MKKNERHGDRRQSLSWKLSDPGMGPLERCGLAALYMTLRAVEEQVHDSKADAVRSNLVWTLTDRSATISWGGPDAAKPALEALMVFAWQVREGVLYLPAVHRSGRQRDNYFFRLPEHNGILRTSLQGKAQATDAPCHRLEAIADDKVVTFRYQPLKGQPAPHVNLAKLFLRGRLRREGVVMTAWLMPGIEPRFADMEVAWNGPVEITLLMMLAPIVCLYQQVQGDPSSELQVIPDIVDLEEFDEVRPHIRLDPICTTGPADAAGAFLAEYTTRTLRLDSRVGCRVVVIGIGDYYHKSNKTRKSVIDIQPDQDSLSSRRYRILHRVMHSRFIPHRDNRSEVAPDVARPVGTFHVPSARGRIADNLIRRQPWYADITVPQRWEHNALKSQQDDVKRRTGKHISVDRLWFQNLCRYQRSMLMQLAKETVFWDSDQERLFYEAFRTVLWRLIEREKEAAQKRTGSRTEEDRIEDLYDDLYRRLTRAKTRQLLRKELTEIMAEPPGRFSRPKTLCKHPDAIWGLVNDVHDWSKARDLALFTLASFGSFRGRMADSKPHTTPGGNK